MSNWVDDFGFSAVDEDTYRKKVVEEEKVAEGERPPVVEKDDLTALEQRLEKKLDSLKNMEKKIDQVLQMAQDGEEIVEERKNYADSLANEKVKAMADIVMPLLSSLYRTQNQAYIHWPNRGHIIEEQINKVKSILDGSAFK